MSSRLRNIFSFGAEPFDPSHRFVTSWILPPFVLCAVRATLSLYAFFVLFFSLGWMGTRSEAGGSHAAGHSFSYFTILTYWGLAFYFLFSAIHTATFARNGLPLLDRFPRPLQALHSLYYSTVTTYPFIVTIVFWAILYSGFDTKFNAWSNTSEHAMNSAFALFEIIMTRADPPPFVHIVFLIIILACYLALAYLTHATENWWVYPFLNPGNGPILAAYIVGIAAAAVVIFSLVNCLIRARKWLTEKKLRKTGKFGAASRYTESAMALENGITSTRSIEK